MLDQLIIGNKSSLDFDASVADRKIGKPKKKEIRETIPFSNITYDFSKINGELYWNDRELSYNLEVIADSPKELEEKKRLLSAWLMNVVEEKIFDPYIADFHFLGTYSDMDFEDDESMLKTTATVIFTAYPYMIANEKKEYKQGVAAGGSATITVVNNSSHRLSPTITMDAPCSITFNDITYTLPAGTYEGDALWLVEGDNVFVISNKGDSVCNIEISFFEEVF